MKQNLVKKSVSSVLKKSFLPVTIGDKTSFFNIRSQIFSPKKFVRNYTMEEDLDGIEKMPITDIFKQQQNYTMLYYNLLVKVFSRGEPLQICREDLRAQDPPNSLSPVSGLILDMSDVLMLMFTKEGFQVVRMQDVTSVVLETAELNKLKPYFEKRPPVPPGLSLQSWETVLQFLSGRRVEIKIKRQDVSTKEYTVTEMELVEGLLHCKLVVDGRVNGKIVIVPDELSEINFYYI